MKKLSFILSILFILGFFSVIHGQTMERTAVIVDRGGMSTEVRNLSIGRKLRVSTETFDVLIPGSNVISIEYIGDGTKWKNRGTEKNRIYDVSYYWMGVKKMISGELSNITLTGQSDFGSFSISSNELKQLRFSQVSDKIKQKEEFHSNGYITLSDGTKLEFGDRSTETSFTQKKYNLKRRSYYTYKYKKPLPKNANDMLYNQERFEWVTRGRSDYHKSIAFDRGKSQGLLEFKDLKSIEFEGEYKRNIIITLKNGTSTKARLNRSNDVRDFDGLNGVCGKGEFYIERENIRIIYFY